MHLRAISLEVLRSLICNMNQNTVEPLWKGQESLTKVAKFGPFPRTILYKSYLFYPSWKATILGGLYRGVPLYYTSKIIAKSPRGQWVNSLAPAKLE